MGFTASTTQAFQYSLPYEQVFNAAMSALQAVDKATLTGADINARFITFETPFSFTSYGERIVVGFIPNEQGVIVEVTCTTKGMPNLMHAEWAQPQAHRAFHGCPVGPRAEHGR